MVRAGYWISSTSLVFVSSIVVPFSARFTDIETKMKSRLMRTRVTNHCKKYNFIAATSGSSSLFRSGARASVANKSNNKNQYWQTNHGPLKKTQSKFISSNSLFTNLHTFSASNISFNFTSKQPNVSTC